MSSPRAAAAVLVLAIAPCLAEGVRIDVVPRGCPSSAAMSRVVRAALPPMPHLGIALGSGSLHGIAHIGVLQEIESRGLAPKVVAGSSVGALVGALWASGVPAAEIERLHRLEDWEDLGAFAWSRAGLFTNERIRERLEKAFAGRPMESWPRRFGAVASDLATGERVLLTRGDGAIAVQASTALPAFFLPVSYEGRRLADGALVEPVPVDAARELGATFVIAVDVAYRPDEAPALTATQIAFQAMHILGNTLAKEQMRRADLAVRIDLHETFMKCGRAAMVAAGREAMREAWPRIEVEMRRAAGK